MFSLLLLFYPALQALPGSPPDVWSKLLEVCERAEAAAKAAAGAASTGTRE